MILGRPVLALCETGDFAGAEKLTKEIIAEWQDVPLMKANLDYLKTVIDRDLPNTVALLRNPKEPAPRPYQFGQRTYALVLKPMGWEEAKAFSESAGGHLAVWTEDKKEFSTWIDRGLTISPFRISVVWLGGYIQADGKFAWVTGEPAKIPANASKQRTDKLAFHPVAGGGPGFVADTMKLPFVIEWDR